MISDCVRSKKALEDDNELFIAERSDPKKWAKKVQVPYKGTDGKLKFHEQDGVDPNIKEMTLMEYQADLKEKKENKKKYKNGMRAGFNLTIGQIDSSVKQDLLTRKDWEKIQKDNLLINLLALLTTICNDSADAKLKLMPLCGMMQMKKYLTYVQGKNVKASNYKDSVRVQFDTMLAQAGEFPYGTSGLKMTVKEDSTISPQPDDRLNWWMTCNDDTKKASLLRKVYDYNMAIIYLNGCNSNTMRTDFGKAYDNRHNNYPRTLEEVCNVHQTIYSKPTKKKKNSINDHNLKSDDNDDDNNKKKDNTTKD